MSTDILEAIDALQESIIELADAQRNQACASNSFVLGVFTTFEIGLDELPVTNPGSIDVSSGHGGTAPSKHILPDVPDVDLYVCKKVNFFFDQYLGLLQWMIDNNVQQLIGLTFGVPDATIAYIAGVIVLAMQALRDLGASFGISLFIDFGGSVSGYIVNIVKGLLALTGLDLQNSYDSIDSNRETLVCTMYTASRIPGGTGQDIWDVLQPALAAAGMTSYDITFMAMVCSVDILASMFWDRQGVNGTAFKNAMDGYTPTVDCVTC